MPPVTFRRSKPPQDIERRKHVNLTNNSQHNGASTSNGHGNNGYGYHGNGNGYHGSNGYGYHGNNGYHGGNNNGYHGARGRGGRYGHQEGGNMSAAGRLQYQISQGQGHSGGFPQRNRGVGIFRASASAAANSQQQQPVDRQVISEPATIIWCEGEIGEVMSPSVWRHPNLHVYFDVTRTTMEGPGGWSGMKTELQTGMEMDVTFTMPNRLLQLLDQQQWDTAHGKDTHTFICVGKAADPRVSARSSLRTYEQAVVIARRATGAVFLINTSGERTVLHPNFLPIDGVRHAILEKATGQRQIVTSEVDDTPSSLCVLGRSLAVRLAPAPCWLPTIYETDRGVSRWALSAEPYGEEKQGRAVVVKASRHSIELCPVEGDLAGVRTSLHAPIIQMTGDIKREMQEVGSCWRFRACRELPGRSALWRAFDIRHELDTDTPITEATIDSVLTGNRLIELDYEDEQFVDPLLELNSQEPPVEKKVSTVLDDLAKLGLVFAQPFDAAAPGASAVPATPTQIPAADSSSENVLVFESIDDLLYSNTFHTDVFRAPPMLHNEWHLLGVPPHEAVKTERELLQQLADLPLVAEPEREYGVFAIGDERPDMRVHAKQRKKRKRRAESPTDACEEEEEDDEEEGQEKENLMTTTARASQPAQQEAPGSSRSQEGEGGVGAHDADKSAAERKRERKEDSRLKKHLESIKVTFASTGDDLFNMLHGGDDEPEAAAPTAATIHERRETAAPATRAASAASPTPAIFVAAGEDLTNLLHGDAEPAALAASASQQSSEVVRTAPAVAAVAPAPASTPVPPPATAADEEPLVMHAILSDELPGRPRAPRFAILPYPEKPRHADGWWWRPTRPRPAPIASRKEARKKKREAEEKWKREHLDTAPKEDTRRKDDLRARLLGELKKKEEEKPADHRAVVEAGVDSPGTSTRQPPKDNLRATLLGEVGLGKKEEKPVEVAPQATDNAPGQSTRQPPKDNLRARLLGEVGPDKKEKPAEPLFVVTASVEREEENVLVDLSPAIDWNMSPSAAADSTPLLQSPTELHDDLKDLF